MRWRLFLALAAVLGMAGWSFRGLPAVLALAAGTPPGFVDEVTQYERRFAAVREKLPPHGAVGYRAQVRRGRGEEIFVYTLDGANYGMHSTKAFFLTQYALAPVIVHRGENRPLLIENRRDGVRLVERK